MNKIEFNDIECKNIVEMYQYGMTYKQIAEHYKCSVSPISKIIRSMCDNIRDPHAQLFSKEDAYHMYQLYLSGNTVGEIAKISGTYRHMVTKLFKRYGLQTDRLTYHCNEEYFDTVDCAEKAYILGLLWADGCNNLSLGKIQLQLQEKDKHILDEINILTDNDRPLFFLQLSDKNSNWQNSYTMILKSHHMAQVLNDYGMTPRKSLTLEFPTWLDESLYSHFLRGYIDGDGSIYCRVDKNICRVYMIGTKMFLDKVQNILLQFDIKTSLYHRDGYADATYTLYTTSNSGSINLLNWIYNDANLKLTRKYDKYQQFLNNNINNSLVE